MFGACLGDVGVFRGCLGKFGGCLGGVWGMFGDVWGLFGGCLGDVWGMFGGVWGCLGGVGDMLLSIFEKNKYFRTSIEIMCLKSKFDVFKCSADHL